MPLRDHFRPPLDNAHSWEELHGQWPAVIVQHLRKLTITSEKGRVLEIGLEELTQAWRGTLDW